MADKVTVRNRNEGNGTQNMWITKLILNLSKCGYIFYTHFDHKIILIWSRSLLRWIQHIYQDWTVFGAKFFPNLHQFLNKKVILTALTVSQPCQLMFSSSYRFSKSFVAPRSEVAQTYTASKILEILKIHLLEFVTVSQKLVLRQCHFCVFC